MRAIYSSLTHLRIRETRTKREELMTLKATAHTWRAVITALRPDDYVVNSNVAEHVCASNSNEYDLQTSNQQINQVNYCVLNIHYCCHCTTTASS